MVRNLGSAARFLLATLVLASFVACSGGRKVANRPTGGGSTFDGSGEFGDLGTGTGTGTQLGTATGTATGITADSTTKTGSIFDKNISDAERTTGNNRLSPTPSETEQACLAYSGSGFNGYGSRNRPRGTNNFDDEGFGTPPARTQSSGLSSACFRDGAAGFDPSLGYDAAYNSLQTMDQCADVVLRYAPSPNDPPYVVAEAFEIGAMAYVRCIRNMLRYQAGYFPWSGEVTQAFQYNDSNLFQIMLLVGNGR